MTGDEADTNPTASPSPQPERAPRGRRPLTSPRREFLNGPKHGGQALTPGPALPAPVSDLPGALPDPAADALADGSGPPDAQRTDGGEA